MTILYTFKGNTNSTPPAPTITQQPVILPIIPVAQQPIPILPSSPNSDSILAASLTMLQHQQQQLQTNVNHTNQQLRNLVQVIPATANTTLKSPITTNDTIQQNLQIIDHINTQQKLSMSNLNNKSTFLLNLLIKL